MDESLYSLIYSNEPLRLWISAVTGATIHPADFPIELREYGIASKGMPCHIDVQMYEDARHDFEVVVTLHNHGSFNVTWYTEDGQAKAVHPDGNSITIVKPGGAVHCVGESDGGNREILKFIMVGSYRKGANFKDYLSNSCQADSPNLIILNKKKEDRRKASDNVEL